jgi:hypothetical protein
LPGALHERHFAAVGGCRYRLVVRRAVAGALRRTLTNLATIFQHDDVPAEVYHERK